MGKSLYTKYDLKQVINASGRMSILGVSAPSDQVTEAMKQGGQRFFEMEDLVHKAGGYIANTFGSEDAVIVNSASSGIALSVSGLITQGNKRKSERLHQDPIAKNEIIMFKGHNVQYGAPIETMIYLGGGTLVEVGYANEGNADHIEEAINENTAAILYVKSHHAVQKNMIGIEEAWQVAKQNGIPLIIDAAAEEDIQKYLNYSDLAIYSGSKAMEGPTSGIVAGKKEYIDWIKVQLSFIGRSMKIGKESIFGLLQAVDDYQTKQSNSEKEQEMLQVLLPLNDLNGVDATIVQDQAGRDIFRAQISIDPSKTTITAKETVHQLRTGEVAIYTRDYGVQQGFFEIDVRSLSDNDIEIIKSRIHQIIRGGSHVKSN